ncbi:Variant surface glycoprotein [Trypanosoma congolense IL3000]|uniref:Variant surface glycoprotein n=1 Tax=Trypanosoma congolense (strain IL3000) TaxID=1068625 RepID=F9WEA5_TRYCI|nr:Variant surface glycoprotein [Trypanosoma congolense IL3000]
MICARNVWVAVVVIVEAVRGASEVNTGKTDHNSDKHGLLCNVLASTVSLFLSKRGGIQLQKAVRESIFGIGNRGEEDATNLKLPTEYDGQGSRKDLCGSCGDSEHHPGGSIPHDILCLCTVGNGGAPFGGDKYYSLCGLSGEHWGCQKYSAGDHYVGTGQQWECIDKNWDSGWDQPRRHTAWEKVVKPCLEKGKTLSFTDALSNLEAALNGWEHPKWGASHEGCGGNGFGDICVKYSQWCYTSTWWAQLKEGLKQIDLSEPETASSRTNANNESVENNHFSRVNRGAMSLDTTHGNKRWIFSTTHREHEKEGFPPNNFSHESDSTIISSRFPVLAIFAF